MEEKDKDKVFKKKILKLKDVDQFIDKLREEIDPVWLGWLGGIIDGEGSISILPRYRSDAKCQYNGWQVLVKVANTDIRMINKIKEIFNYSLGKFGHTEERRKNRCNKVYYWIVSSRQTLVLLKLILPYLICKKEQANLAIKMQERILAYIGIEIKGRDSKGRMLRGSTLTEDEVKYREKLYLEMKELNKKGNDRQERIEKNL